jgi:chromosome segregation ATPase
MIRAKDDEIAKLREDNSNMFKDLKEYAENEESLKQELMEYKTRKGDAEALIEDLREKSHNQEVKLRTMQVEVEKLRREA